MKKIIALILAVLLVVCVMVVLNATGVLASADAAKGDVNNDGSLDIVDVALVRANIVGTLTLNEDQKIMGDMNSDSIIDIIDIAMMRNTIVNSTIGEPDEPVSGAVDQYGFLVVNEKQIEKAYRALIEFNSLGKEPTQQDIRIVYEDCVRYIYETDNGIFETWTLVPDLTKQTGSFRLGKDSSEYAGKYWNSEKLEWCYKYNEDTTFYNEAYENIRNDAHKQAHDFIDTYNQKGFQYHYYTFNYDVSFEYDNYNVTFIYGWYTQEVQ